jgi:hypothetical protein
MGEQVTNEAEQSDSKSDQPVSPETDTKKKALPGRSRKAARKPAPSARKNASTQKPTNVKSRQASSGKRKRRFGRKQILVALIAVFLLVDAVLAFAFLGSGRLFGGSGGESVEPYTDQVALIQGQMAYNRNIYEIGYDEGLTFANYPNLTIVNTSSLKPIENDLLKAAGGPDGEDLLYDELIIRRILKLNSDWIDHINRGDQSVFTSVQEGSEAQPKLVELAADASGASYHRLAIGEMRHVGKNYYLITRATYTLTKAGQLDIHDDILVYKLVAQGDTMLVVDIEQIPGSPPPNEPASEPANETPEEPLEDAEEDVTFEESPDATEEETFTEPDEEFEEEPSTEESTNNESEG